MKKYIYTALLSVILLIMTVTGASAVYSYEIKNAKITASPQTDGSVIIDSEWNLTFDRGASDGFEFPISFPSDERYCFDTAENISAFVDGTACSLCEEGATAPGETRPADGTYCIVRSGDRMYIRWNMRSYNTAHVFRLSYTLTGLVKNIDGDARFYCEYIPADLAEKCVSAEITVVLPEGCKGKQTEILTSNPYLACKNDTTVVLTGGKTADSVFVGMSMPSRFFDSLRTYKTTPDTVMPFQVVLIVIAGVIAVLILAVIIFSRRILIRIFRRKCRRAAYDETSYNAQNEVFDRITSAEALKTVKMKTHSAADLFIVTVTELAAKGVLTVSGGKITCRKSGIRLAKHEKSVISFFRSDSDHTGADFFRFINKFNRQIHPIRLWSCFSPKNREICRLCFELAMSAEHYENISAKQISADAFKEGRSTSADTFIAMVKDIDSAVHFSSGIYAFREVYEQGFRDIMDERRKADTAEE